MKKRILGLFFVCLMATMLSTTAFATDYTVDGSSASGNNYDSVSAALSVATSGDTVTITGSEMLNSDAAIAEGVELIIDSGATLTIVDSATLTIASGATLTNNGTIVVNDGTNLATALNADLSGTVKLGSDITLTGDWTPIGSSESTAFKGTFDGSDGEEGTYTISGLNVTGSNDYAGLFGYIDGATIKDLTVEGTVSGGTYVGGIVGYAKGAFTIENCTNNATVSGTKKVAGILGATTSDDATSGVITGCTNNGTITITAADQEQAAGIVGYAYGVTISSCTNNGTVTNASNYTAGIVAYTNSCDIDGCTNNGTITGTTNVGGIVGMNKADSSYKSSIDNCANTGTVAGTSDYGQIVGSEANFTLGTGDDANTSDGSIVEVYTGAPLKFTSETADQTTDCYTWNNETATLTIIKDMTIVETATGSTARALSVPNGAEIILQADLNITSAYTGLYVTGDLTITGDGGALTINADEYGIVAQQVDDDVNGNYGTLSIENCTEITIDSDTYAIDTEGDLKITNSTLYLTAEDNSLDVADTIITNSTIYDYSDDGIVAYSGSITIDSSDIYSDSAVKISNGSDSDLTIKGDSYVEASTINVDGSITISGSAEVTTTSFIYAQGSNITISDSAEVTASYIYSVTENITATANAVVITGGSGNYASKVYGTVVVAESSRADTIFNYAGTLAFMSDSKLTIDKDATVDWTGYTIDWTNANIVNNGVISVLAGTEVIYSKITGDGYVKIGDVTYDTDGGTVFGSLTFASNIEHASTDYYEWDKDSSTLTLRKDMTIITTGNGITLSNGGTIDLGKYTLTITTTASSAYGIYTAGDLTIKGTGTLNITSGGRGIYASNANITIGGSADVNVKTIGNGASGIEASGGDIEISGFANVTVNAKGNNADGIRANANDITITTTGNVTVYAAGYGINTNNITGSITIKDATVVNTSVSSINSITIKIDGTAKVSSTSKIALGNGTDGDDFAEGGFDFDELSATLNAVVAVVNKNEDESITMDYTVYGDVVVTSTLQGDNLFDGVNELVFADGSKLTINQGVALSLLSYSTSSDTKDTISGSIKWTNANVINNGVIYLNDIDYYSSANSETDDEDDTDIASLGITGDGYIALMKGTWDEGYNYATSGVYDKDGTAVAYVVKNDNNNSYDETLELDDTSVTGNGYTWTVTDGVGTLTVEDDFVFNSGLKISDVDSVNIVVTNGKLTIAGRGVDDNLIATGTGNLTITGDLVVTGYIWIDGDLTVDGNLVAGAVFAGSMEVPTDSTVNLLGEKFDGDSTYSDRDKTYALRLSDATQEPTLTLGDNVSILTAGVTYAIGETNILDSGYTYYNTGTFINDGETPDFSISWYNIASTVSIGKTPTTSTSRPSVTTPTTTTETTTNDDGSATATVTPSTTTSSGTTSATVKDSVIDSAIEDAVDEADGEAAHVEIAVDTKTSTDTVEVKLTTDAITAVADSDVESLTISSDLGTITIPSDALAEIASQATGSDIVISLVLMEDNDHLTREQQTLVKDAQVYDLHITSDGEKIESFGGHEITVTLPYELADGESAEHIVIWYLGDDGEMSALEGNYDADAGMATFATPHFSYYAALHHNNPFEDVVLDDYFYAPVQWAVEMGITKGTSDTTFSPEKVCTRAEAVMFLWNAAGNPEATGDMIFTDVDADSYYYDAVLWAVENGITKGTSDTTFSPNETCTRSQIVTFLWNYAGNPVVNYLMTFTDVDADTWYSEAVRWAVSEGITIGTGDTTFSPDADCTRGQIVTFLYRNLAD